MADPIADNADLAVDELKRRARRRLIGAIVLALAAATLLPLLLEQEQKPLGDDVSVQIPPIDDGKYVNRLNGEKGKDAPPAPKADARAEAKGDVKPGPKADTRSEPTADARAEPKAAAKPEPTADGKPEPKTGAETAPAEPGAGAASVAGGAAPDAERPKSEGYIVQLGAFTDAYGANALSNRLKKAGYPAYTEPIDTSRGTLWRVRVGGYPSRAAAVEARDKLKADGQNGIVSAAK